MNQILSLLLLVWLYFCTKYFSFGNEIFYPFQLFVTFLHEFWHAFFSIITWGSVVSLDINSNWSWLTTTKWGIISIMLMWGYIWSAFFWGLLLMIWSKYRSIAKYVLLLLSSLLIFSSVFWFSDIISSFIQVCLAVTLFLIYYKNNLISWFVLELLWIFSLLYIIQDFNVWPTSDLSKFSTILPQAVWMYIWLVIVLCIFTFFVKITYFSEREQNKSIY